MNNNYSVYVHIFPNNKTYVGLTNQNCKTRWGHNGNGYKGQFVYSAIQEFGWNNIEHKILYMGLTAQEAYDKEIELIKNFDSIENGYNIDTGGGMGGKPWCEFKYNKQIYTAEELAELSKYDITSHDITTRINHHGWSIEKAINTPKGRKNVCFDYNGEKYTAKELYNIRINKDLSFNQIKCRLLENWDVYRAISQPNNVKKQPFGVGTCRFEYNGKTYNSYELSLLSNIEGLTSFHITDRINHKGWSVERAITTPLLKGNNNKYEYNGVMYTTKELQALSPYDISMSLIRRRIKNGWSVDKTINTPSRKKNKSTQANQLPSLRNAE